MSLPRNVTLDRRTGHAAECAVAVAASAGGLQAVSQVLSALPRDFPAALLIVQHLDPRFPSFMAQILSRRTRLAVRQACEGERLFSATAYIAPPDRHLTLHPDDTIRLSRSAQVHYVRPSADMTFGAIATNFGPRATGVVLTGSGSDGADGLHAIKRAGGTVIVHDARSAQFTGMPRAAIETGLADFILDLAEIAVALTKVVAGSVS